MQRTPPSEPNNDIDTEQEVDLPPPPPPPPANEKPLRPRSLIRPRSLHGPLTVTGADAQPATAVPVPALPDPTAFPLGGNASNTAATEDPLDMIDRSPLPVDDHRRRYYDTEITHIYHQELQKDLFPRSQPPPPSPPPITEHPTPARPFPLAFSLYQSPNILTNHHTGIYMLGVSRRRPLYAVSVHDPADQRGHNDAHHHHASKRKSRLMRGGAGSSNGSGFPLEHAHSHANSHGHEPSLVLYNGADLDYDDRLGGSGSTVSPWAAVHLGSGTWGEDMGIELPVLDPEERKRLVDVDFDDDVDRGPLDTGKRSVVEPVRGWLLPDARSLRFVFSVEVTVTTGSHRPKLHGDTGVRLVREQFEWRHTRGEEAIARLTAGTGGGGKRTNAPENWAWKLVRLGPKGRDKSPLHSHDAKPTGPAAIPAVNAAELDTDDVDILHPVMPPVSSSSLSLRTADNHDVVLLLLTSYPRSLTKRAKFLFVGPGATGELGPRFAVAAVATGLGLWERGRRGGGSGGGGGGGIGIVNGGSPTGVGAGTAAGSNGGGWNASATPPSVSVAF